VCCHPSVHSQIRSRYENDDDDEDEDDGSGNFDEYGDDKAYVLFYT